jgi:acyl carrier protein
MNIMTPHDRDGIFVEIVTILKEMTVDWDMAVGDAIELDTDIIADLGFVSVDVIQLIVAIESRFKRRDLAFDKLLMRDGAYVEALHVRDVIEHLHERLNVAPA